MIESRARVVDADAGRRLAGKTEAVVADGERGWPRSAARVNRDLVSAPLSQHAVLQRVLDEGFEHECRDAGVEQVMRHIHRHAQTIAKAQTLDVEIARHELE